MSTTSFIFGIFRRTSTVLIALTILVSATWVSAQRLGRDVSPKAEKPLPAADTIDTVSTTVFQYPARPELSCADLNSFSAASFLHITKDWEQRFEVPVSGTYPISNGIEGGMPANPNLFLTYETSGVGVGSWQLSWATPSARDRLISAVIVSSPKLGSTVYTYPQLSASGSGGMIVGEGEAPVRRVSFCFESVSQASRPDAFVAGRVTDAWGRPIRGADITLYDLISGEVRTVFSNTFGYYRFTGLPAEDMYLINVSHGRYLFVSGSISFSLEQNITDLDFTATY